MLIGRSQADTVQAMQDKSISHLEGLGLKIPVEKVQASANEVQFWGIWWKGGMTCIPQDTLSTLDQIKRPETKSCNMNEDCLYFGESIFLTFPSLTSLICYKFPSLTSLICYKKECHGPHSTKKPCSCQCLRLLTIKPLAPFILLTQPKPNGALPS